MTQETGVWEVTRFKVIDDTGVRFNAIMRRTADGMARAAGDTGKLEITLLEAVYGVVGPALRRALRTSGDPILGTQAVVMGALWSAGRTKAAGLRFLSEVSRSVIRQTVEMRGDVGAAVTGLVRGALAGSERLGVPRAKSAAAVVHAAVEEIQKISSGESRLARSGASKRLAQASRPWQRRRTSTYPECR